MVSDVEVILRCCDEVRKEVGLSREKKEKRIDYEGFIAQAQKNLDCLQILRVHPAEFCSKHGMYNVLAAEKGEFGKALAGILDKEYRSLMENFCKAGIYLSKLALDNRKIDAYAPKLDDYADALIEKKGNHLRELDNQLESLNSEIIRLAHVMLMWESGADEGTGPPIHALNELFSNKNSLTNILNETSRQYDLAIKKVKALKEEMESRRKYNEGMLGRLGKCRGGLEFYLERYSIEDYQRSIEGAVRSQDRKRNHRLAAVVSLGAAALMSAFLLFKPLQPGKTTNALQNPASIVEIVPAPGSEPQQAEPYVPQDVEGMFRSISGRIPIEMFHYISNDRNISQIRALGIQERYIVSAGELRRHFAELYHRGFRPVSIEEYAGDLSSLPEGTKPILLTVDDATFGQFDFINPTDTFSFGDSAWFDYKGNSLLLDPDCFVAILRDFSAHHPDFRAKAAFAVDFANAHANGYEAPFLQPEFVGMKLNLLLDWGMDIINHGMCHKDYSHLGVPEMTRDAGMALGLMQGYLGYRVKQVKSFAFPYGAVPDDPASLAILKGFAYNDEHYEHNLLFAAWGGAAANPYNSSQQLIIPRIEVCSSTFPNLIYNRNDFYRTPIVTPGPAYPGNGAALK